MFTDIEASTRLLRRLGGRYVGVLERHRALLRPGSMASSVAWMRDPARL